jgi:sugar lactone lactonase YvrE
MRAAIVTFRRIFRRLSVLGVAAAIAILSGDRLAAQPGLPGLVFGSPSPGRLVVDAAGNIYAIDLWGVRVYNPSGAPERIVGSVDSPTDIAVAADGSTYVADSGTLRVWKFGPSGGAFSFGEPGQAPGQFFNRIMSLALDSSGNVYVGSVFQLQKFSPSGTLIRAYELGGILPEALAIARNGDIVMYEKDNGTINVYDNNGTSLFRFSGVGCNIEAGFGCSTDQRGAIEPGDGELRGDPGAIAVDALGNIYVADSANHRIQKFSADGTFLWKFGGPGTNYGQFGNGAGPLGLAVDASGSLYVADSDNNRIQVFRDEQTIAIADRSVVEGNAGVVEALFTVSLSTPSSNPVSVQFAAADGTAQAGPDYRPASGTLTFAPGETTASIAVLVEGDTAQEPDETFTIQLSSPVGATLADDRAVGTIVNDDEDDDPGNGDDTTAPQVTYSIDPPPNAAGWNNTPVQLTWTVSDAESGIASTSGCETRQLAADPTDLTFTCTATNGDGLSATVSAAVRIDRTPPAVSCGTPDSLWHATDVSIPCTATDGASGVVFPGSSFTLSTGVVPGTETNAAATGLVTVVDRAGNSIQAGPVAPIKVDKKAPTISIVSPQPRNYVLNEPVTSQYFCSDDGSLVGSCVGTEGQGSVLSPGVGTHLLQVNAADRVGNRSSASLAYSVSYAVCLLYDPSAPLRIGVVAPVWVTLCDANGRNVSSSTVALKAIELVNVATGAVTRPRSAFPPFDAFYYVPWPGRGSYVFPLVTLGLQPGQYELRFRAGVDPTVHVAPLRLR